MERSRRGGQRGRKPKTSSISKDADGDSGSHGNGLRSPPPRSRSLQQLEKDHDSANVDDSMSEDEADDKEATAQGLLQALIGCIEEAEADILDEKKHGSKSKARHDDADDDDGENDGHEETAAEFKEHMLELKKKVQMIEDGTFAEYCRRCVEFKEDRSRALQTARQHRELQLKNVQDLLLFDYQKAEDLYATGKDCIKYDMMSHVYAMLDDVAAQLTQLDADPTADEPPVAKKPKLADGLLPPSECRLALPEVQSDVAAICDSWKTTPVLNDTLVPVPTSCRRGVLSCGDFLFDEGDEVVLSSNLMQREYVGTIQSFTDDALYVVLNTGEKARILFQMLQEKRCAIMPFQRGNSGVKSLQSSGWVRCEPF
ncbi:hypothetical protein SPRG_14481 [Saprolegnia parasitica CBS 223.65]|uniref:Uncharacterized protein n=1 Tax=Saprolegnia parasitica (strain CBS 223.65) TaxID=695850 RepID=A0A067BTU0_SAPPC|nr:hypothetical protein SPRG_14481 [Saprolegnia parasitica CBS 223.65]KDO20235.1 hypothetical protein SPRG_14481 [Saprolegnia parasitica CBS 223.65]|eukprot:XP_012209048.1 hypothetical protein SPRG_14481 [Saprolegnia parasitica CBS 223.65]